MSTTITKLNISCRFCGRGVQTHDFRVDVDVQEANLEILRVTPLWDSAQASPRIRYKLKNHGTHIKQRAFCE